MSEISLSLGNYKEALEAVETSEKHASEEDLPLVYSVKSEVLYNMEKGEDALAAVQKSISLDVDCKLFRNYTILG